MFISDLFTFNQQLVVMTQYLGDISEMLVVLQARCLSNG